MTQKGQTGTQTTTPTTVIEDNPRSEGANTVVYPISELFDSFQGEGVWAGTRMFFIRLAGCTVGKPYPKEQYGKSDRAAWPVRPCHPELPIEHALNEILPIYTEKCTLYDGREFPCDTDYRVKERLTVQQIGERIPKDIEHVCITGGEPFMHNLEPLINGLLGGLILEEIHIETSGTVLISKAFPTQWRRMLAQNTVWITVSPKQGVLSQMALRANEIKLLVDENFDPASIPDYIMLHPKIFIQPVNGEHTINGANLRRCIELQQRFPNWIVSPQMHKVVEHFTKERIR